MPHITYCIQDFYSSLLKKRKKIQCNQLLQTFFRKNVVEEKKQNHEERGASRQVRDEAVQMSKAAGFN